MLEWPFLFVSGLVGSSHCLGMCGGFAMALGGQSRSSAHNVGRQIMYTAGRVFTYASLGALAGFGGWRLTSSFPSLVRVPAWLAILAGVTLVYQGLLATGWLRAWLTPPRSITCLAASWFRPLLGTGGYQGAFLAGLFTGLLPCGLLYGMLALAASTHAPAPGALTMAFFGAGTAPAMIAAGWSGSLWSLGTRRCLFAVATWCLIVSGGISILRGASVLMAPPALAAKACPLCRE